MNLASAKSFAAAGAHALWRLLPPALRREALFTAMELLAPKPVMAPPPAACGPITVAGFFRAPSGLGEGTRRLADMLEVAGAEIFRVDLTGALRQSPGGPPPLAPQGPGTLIMHVNGPMLPWGIHALGNAAIQDKRILAFWNWELPKLPKDWNRGYRFVHGILAPSQFVAAALRRPDGPPVAVVHYPLPPPMPSSVSRADLGLPDQAFLFLSIFDAASSVERKNPMAAIAAHRQAFGDRQDRVLVLKTYNTHMGGSAWRETLAAATTVRNIRIIDREMNRAEIWGLLRLSDALVSLHRSEGFGLSLCEAMSLGKPVIASGWSGNLDFMDHESAILVDCRLVPATDERSTYSLAGAHWAEPDISAAAEAFRTLADNPQLCSRLGTAAQNRTGSLTYAACGARAMAALGLGHVQ